VNVVTYRVWPVVVCVGLVFPALFGAEEKKYTIKTGESRPGDRSLQESTSTEETNTKLLDTDGKVLKEENKKTVVTQKYTETILEREKGKRPTRLRRVYEKVEIKVGDAATSPSYQGKTVVIEKRKDDEYHFSIEGGGELTGKDAELLEKEFNRKGHDPEALTKLILPDKPIALNETWKIGVKKPLQFLVELPFDTDKGQVTGKLVKTYEQNGHLFGVIEYQFDMGVKGEVGPGGKGDLLVLPGSKFGGRAKIDACIDGSAAGGGTYDSQFNMNLTVKFKDREPKLIIVGKMTEKKTAIELPPEKK
jgi:hypothetical protein